jgi:hypothetical protein
MDSATALMGIRQIVRLVYGHWNGVSELPFAILEGKRFRLAALVNALDKGLSDGHESPADRRVEAGVNSARTRLPPAVPCRLAAQRDAALRPAGEASDDYGAHLQEGGAPAGDDPRVSVNELMRALGWTGDFPPVDPGGVVIDSWWRRTCCGTTATAATSRAGSSRT